MKKSIAFLLSIIMVMSGVVLSGCSSENTSVSGEKTVVSDGPLNETELYVKQAVNTYKSESKSSEPLSIIGDIGYIELENGTKYVIVGTKDNDSLGIPTKADQIILNGEYISSLDTIKELSDDIKNQSTTSMTRSEMIEKASLKIKLAFIYNTVTDYITSGKGIVGNKYGTPSGDSVCKTVEVICGQRIAKEIGCDYSE